MSKRSHALRALVSERLSAAAEEIFELFERTITEYEEELCRSKEENQRSQQLLDSALSRILVHRTDVQVQTELENSLKQTSEALPLQDPPEVSTLALDCDVKAELEEQPADVDVEPPGSSSTQTLKTETEEEHFPTQVYDPVHAEPTPSLLPPPEYGGPSSIAAPLPDADRGDVSKKHECCFCGRRFREVRNLERHIAVHTRPKPFACGVCSRSFSQEETLRLHEALHGESVGSAGTLGPRGDAGGSTAAGPIKVSPFSCPICDKRFTRTFSLQSHMLTHTGEKPFPCPLCSTRFNRKSNLNRHLKVHAQKYHNIQCGGL